VSSSSEMCSIDCSVISAWKEFQLSLAICELSHQGAPDARGMVASPQGTLCMPFVDLGEACYRVAAGVGLGSSETIASVELGSAASSQEVSDANSSAVMSTNHGCVAGLRDELMKPPT
jgi:hypothetical protein